MVFIGFYDVLEVFLNENGLEKKNLEKEKFIIPCFLATTLVI
jgi:sulfur relay (sulfurtransferase) DsrF/TusC family protein